MKTIGAALLTLGLALAARGQGFEDAVARTLSALGDSARGGALPAFGAVPPGTLTGADRERLVASLPAFAESRDGRPVDAINLVFAGARAQVGALLRETDWTAVPTSELGSVVGGVLRGRPDLIPPFSRLYVDGRAQDQNWSRPVSLSSRHHFRVWDGAGADALGRAVWPAAAVFDAGVIFTPLPDHVADPDVDKERDFVYAALIGSPRVARLSFVASGRLPRRWTVGSQVRFTDGRVLVVELAP
jgi:hypothetical protein